MIAYLEEQIEQISEGGSTPIDGPIYVGTIGENDIYVPSDMSDDTPGRFFSNLTYKPTEPSTVPYFERDITKLWRRDVSDVDNTSEDHVHPVTGEFLGTGQTTQYCDWENNPTEIWCQDGELTTDYMARMIETCSEGSCQVGIVRPSGTSTNVQQYLGHYPQAEYCHVLEADGYDDWYLPAPAEMMEIYASRDSIPYLGEGKYPTITIAWNPGNSDRIYTMNMEIGEFEMSYVNYIDIPLICVRKG
jgi:hypothetical protein